jgi:hypothetical protein
MEHMKNMTKTKTATASTVKVNPYRLNSAIGACFALAMNGTCNVTDYIAKNPKEGGEKLSLDRLIWALTSVGKRKIGKYALNWTSKLERKGNSVFVSITNIVPQTKAFVIGNTPWTAYYNPKTSEWLTTVADEKTTPEGPAKKK